MICLKCGWEIVIGPGGCACTQAARREREAREAKEAGERLVKLITDKFPDFGKRVAMEDLTTKSVEELRKISDDGDKARTELNRRYNEEAKKILERCDTGEPPFKDEELVFARDAKCPCGERLAYPKNTSPMQGFWDCVGLLKRTAPPKGHPDAKTHTDRLPFIFWDIKSEDQR